MARDRAARPEAKPIRLFVAVDVPESARNRVAEVIAPFRERVPVARWTRPDGWHVTIKFLGSTWPRLVGEVRDAMAEAAATVDPVETSLTQVGVFASVRRARVIWVGLDDPGGALAIVAKDLDERLSDFFVPEKRGLTPHLTLARMNPPRDISEFAPDLVGTPVTTDPFVIDTLVLYRSHLSPAGARYEPIESVALGAG
jgi:2'-5' RNA ligase